MREPGWTRHTAVAKSHLDPLPDSLRGAGGVWAVGIVRDEVDIVGTVITNLLAQGVERVVIADNLSVDGTAAVLEGLARSHPVTVLADRLGAHYQAEKTTLLARAAAAAGAGWVLPFDADEVWTLPPAEEVSSGTGGAAPGTVAQWLAGCDADVVQVPVFNHVPTDDDDDAEPDPVRRQRWRKDAPNRLHKVAFRAHPRARLHQGNHGVDRRGRRRRGLVVHHFPYRTEEQFVRKVRQGSAALAATELTAEVGKHWRGLGAGDDAQLHAAWRSLVETHNLDSEWWVPRHGLVEDPVDLGGLTSGR
jgi:glycosyltransferase involved in cell wall biosynthesis